MTRRKSVVRQPAAGEDLNRVRPGRHAVHTMPAEWPSSVWDGLGDNAQPSFDRRICYSKTLNRPSSVWAGNDRDLLKWVIPFYWRLDGLPRILDATWGLGNFWPPITQSRVISLDISGRGLPTVVGDNRAMPFLPRSFDVVVYDPPHLADSATTHASKIYLSRYGDAGAGEKVEDQFLPFFLEAKRVLADDGIVVCKISDMVHNKHANWHHVELMRSAEQVGLTVCDLIVKTRRMALMGRWHKALHVRKFHCFWIICRKGNC